MKKLSQDLFIKSPCFENYDAMANNSAGKFCEKCSHAVQDFTGWEKEDIVVYLKSRGEERTCGRFDSRAITSSRSSFWKSMKYSVAAAVAFLFFRNDVKAQSEIQTPVQSLSKTISDSVVIIVRGEVRCDTNEVRDGRVIALNTSGDTIAETSVMDGRFELHVPAGNKWEQFTLVASAPGYKPITLPGYVSSGRNIVLIELEKSPAPRKAIRYVSLGCPSF